MKSTHVLRDAGRFLLAGGLNTLLSYLLYLLLLLVVSYQVAYALSWVFGVLFIALVYPTRVFPGSERSTRKLLVLVGQYVSVFLFGLFCITFTTASLGVDERLSALITMAITTALNFFLGRLLFRGRLLGAQ